MRAALAALPVLAITICLYLQGARSDGLLIEAETARQGENSAAELHAFVEAHLDALRGIGNFAVSAAASMPEEYARFVERAMADTPGFEVIAWHGPDGAPGRALPAGRPLGPVAVDGPIAQEACRKAIASGQPAGTDVYEIEPGEPAVTLAAPVFRGARYEGVVLGAVRLRQAMRALYGVELQDLWNVEIRDHSGHLAFRSVSSSEQAAVDSHAAVADRSWRVRLWPTAQFVAALHTAAPQRIFGLGLLATLVVAAATFRLGQRQESLAASLRESTRLAADLAAAQRHLSELVNGIEAVVWESDLAMERFTYVNDFGRKLLGLDTRDWAAEPGFWYEHVHPDDRARARANARAALLPGRTYPEEYRILAADGRTLWVREIITVIDEDGLALGRRGVIVDITARVQAEEALRQSQKLESLGVLAGGIAHDFNNLLTTILGNAEMLGRQLGPAAPPAAAAYLDKIERTTRRLADLTRQMLAYSGRGKFTVTALDLNVIISEMIDLLAVSTSKNVEVTYHLDPRLPFLDGDVTQIRQVVLNLLTNAAEAIGEQARGKVTVRTVARALTSTEAETLFPGNGLAPGSYAQLEVSDTGCGMSAETLSKIFDPFFTTKFTGRGLGLAALRGIVRSHRGGVRIFSRVGEGTVFTLAFPASADPRLGHGGGGAGPPAAQARGRRLRALIVDDEEGLRTLMAEALREDGLDVLEAADGLQGVAEFRRHAGEIDIVILDLTMPRLNGDEALAQITALRPDACVILCSGYTKEEVDRQFAGRRLAGFIEKPFTPSELIKKIRAVLAERRGQAAEGAWLRDERRYSLNIDEASPNGPRDVSPP